MKRIFTPFVCFQVSEIQCHKKRNKLGCFRLGSLLCPDQRDKNCKTPVNATILCMEMYFEAWLILERWVQSTCVYDNSLKFSRMDSSFFKNLISRFFIIRASSCLDNTTIFRKKMFWIHSEARSGKCSLKSDGMSGLWWRRSELTYVTKECPGTVFYQVFLTSKWWNKVPHRRKPVYSTHADWIKQVSRERTRPKSD